jgi:hypothetical protein
MENQNEQMDNLSLNLKRALALKTHLQENFFFWQGIPYEGTLSDAQQQFSDLDTDSKESGFDEFVISNFVEIEEIDGDEWDLDHLVLTDSEADDRWEDYLDNYIEDCLEIPKHLENYFDEEKWKTDARYDGRGCSLASYDGHENQQTIGGETFYIYRTN